MGGLTIGVVGHAGFLGRHVAARAHARGHHVVPVGRPNNEKEKAFSFFVGDVLILAATVHGAWGGRVVMAGSLSVYGAGPAGGVIDEGSPLEDRPEGRDDYARAKLAQEEAWRGSGEVWTLRIGALFGPGRLWNAHLGLRLGPVAVRLGEGPVPVSWVEHAALACVLAAETPGGGVVNVVDDDLPDARRYLRALGVRAVPLPWRALDAAAPWLAGLPVPGLLRRPSLRARLMPRAWPNRALHERLGWEPLMGFEAAMAASR